MTALFVWDLKPSYLFRFQNQTPWFLSEVEWQRGFKALVASRLLRLAKVICLGTRANTRLLCVYFQFWPDLKSLSRSKIKLLDFQKCSLLSASTVDLVECSCILKILPSKFCVTAAVLTSSCFFSVPRLAKNQLGWIRDVGELSGSVADCLSALNDIWAILFLCTFLCFNVTVLVLNYVMDQAGIRVFLFREEDFTKSMYPTPNGSSNAQPCQHLDQKKVNLVCDMMRVAMERIDPEKWAFAYGEGTTR